MTKTEREELKRLVRERARVAKADTERRTADLKASFEEQITQHYDYDTDAVWEQAAAAAVAVVEAANEKIRERCIELGIPAEFAPGISYSWNARNPRYEVQRSQGELRRAAYARLGAMERTAKHEIDRSALEIQTELVRAGLTTETGVAFMERMPSVEALMPPLDLLELTRGAGGAGPEAGDDLGDEFFAD